MKILPFLSNEEKKEQLKSKIKKTFSFWFDREKREEQRTKIFEVIFQADSFYGQVFDIVLLITIIISVMLVMLESVPLINAKYHHYLIIAEWIITLLFTVEYALRLYSVKKPWHYFISFYGIIDLLSIMPTYLGIIWPSTKFLSSIRILRLFRIFRIFKLTQFLRGSNMLIIALKRTQTQIVAFLSFVILVGVVLGSLMYVLEVGAEGSVITTMPTGIYWALVTLTTIGYGDITPITTSGRFLASVVMVIGYGVIAVPGILAVGAYKEAKSLNSKNTLVCQHCHDSNHDDGANFCKTCGYPLYADLESPVNIREVKDDED